MQQFWLDEENEKIKQAAREFAEREFAPLAEEVDRTGIFPLELYKKIGAQRFVGLEFPKKYGGLGTSFLSYVLVHEELNRACPGLAGSIAGGKLALDIILRFGNEEQRQKYLPSAMNSEKIACFATTEPDASSDLQGIKTTARKDGKYWILNGTKRYITNGPFADIAVVFAKTGDRRMTAFILEMNLPGVTRGPMEDIMGVRGQSISDIIMEDVRVPDENIIAGEGKGMFLATNGLNGGRIVVASAAVGIAQAAFEESVKYAKMRTQFGQPLANFQVIQFYLTNMAIAINAARGLVHKAAAMRDANIPHAMEASMAKCFASETAMDVTRKAVQIHGGLGFTKKCKVERLYRDAKIFEIFEGTNEIQRIIISRSILKS